VEVASREMVAQDGIDEGDREKMQWFVRGVRSWIVIGMNEMQKPGDKNCIKRVCVVNMRAVCAAAADPRMRRVSG